MTRILAASALLLLFLTSTEAAYVDLAWDPNTEPDLAGYQVYYGTESGEYIYFIDVGNTTTYRLDGLLDGVTYYIAVTAYDIAENESDYSNEVAYNSEGHCTCDINFDGQCDDLDWAIFQTDWERTDCNDSRMERCECDLDANGRCEMQDWLLFSEDWGRTDCPRQ
jgi:hypothetical protein